MATSSLVRRRRDEIVRQVRRAGDVPAVFEAVSSRLRHVVPFDTAMWWTTDPVTGLPAGPPRLDGIIDNRDCRGYWEHELLGEDVVQFRELAGAELPVGTLRAATGERPTRSSRYCQFLRPAFGDELRAVLRIDGTPWGLLSLMRQAGRPAFSEADVAVVADLARPLAAAVRACARGGPRRATPPDSGTGLLLFDREGNLISINDAGQHWLAELSDDPANAPSTSREDVLPTWLTSFVVRAGQRSAWARVRSGGGQWLTCRASRLRGPSGKATSTALVIEPARAADVAPILVEAYELTDREKQVTGLIARGASTAEIASTLYLSSHTVRDHVKAVLEKLQVSSRGELVAKLFAEHHFS